HRSREIGDSLSNNELRWRGRVREGEALRGLGRLDEAQRVFEDAIGLVRSLTPDAASSAETRTQLDETASAWAGLAFTLAQRGDAVGALAAEEQRRAHIRQLFLAPFERDIVVGSTTADQEAERATMRDLIGARAKLRAERASRHPDAARMDDLRRQVTALSKARVDQQTALYARVPDLALWRGLQPAPQAADLNGLIPPGMLVVEFLVSEEQVLLLSAVHGDTAPDVAATIVPIKKPDLTTAIGQALDTQSLDDAAVWRKRSASLADVLVKPIASRLAGRDRVILLPDDVLWKIPFEALANGEADLATRATVTYATSLTTLAAQRRNAEPPPVSTSSPPAASTTSPQVVRPAFAAVAGPAIAPLLQAQLAVSTPGWTPPDPASSIGSSQRLAALYGEGSKVVVGGDSTKPAVRALLASADVLDLAAPLQMNGVNPLFTVVLLAPDTSSDDSGRWEVREWFAEHARARVLSVPDGTTSGGARAGAALDAMAWASAAAGVSTIAIGRWPSNGYAIDAVLSSFHEALAKSTRPADALRRAISSAKANKDDESPGAWAGLRLIGW
ncbi:MAG TPA: CHAT domain-containing protein, partial [Vicinamibacterales bacterium]